MQDIGERPQMLLVADFLPQVHYDKVGNLNPCLCYSDHWAITAVQNHTQAHMRTGFSTSTLLSLWLYLGKRKTWGSLSLAKLQKSGTVLGCRFAFPIQLAVVIRFRFC